jgi:2'-5' RNA ligase
MRLFIAVLPPAEILDEVDRAMEPYRATWSDLRWLRRDNWHLTLTFLGDVDDDLPDKLAPRVERAAARRDPFELSFGGAGAFPRPARASVVWADVKGDRKALGRLADSTTAAGRRAGAPPDRHRDFNPHLTLARSRRHPVDVRPLVTELSAYAGKSWTVDAIHLVRSNLGQQENRYETLTSWPLGRDASAADGTQ